MNKREFIEVSLQALAEQAADLETNYQNFVKNGAGVFILITARIHHFAIKCEGRAMMAATLRRIEKAQRACS